MSEPADSTPRVAPIPDISVVIPVGDAAPDLHDVLLGCCAEFAEQQRLAEFLVVLDGVPDRVFESVRQARPAGANVRFVRLNHPFGESIALQSGFSHAKGRVILTLPPYQQVELKDLGDVLDAVDGGLDLVVGLRSPRVDPIVNRIQSRLFNLFMRTMTGVPLHDMNCPLRAMKRKVLEDVTVQGDMVRFLPVLAHRHGFRVGEVTVRHLRERGKSGFFGVGVYIRRFLDIINLLFLSKFTRAPLRFFGVAGILAILLGVLICTWLVADHFLRGGEAPRNRSLLVIGVMLIVLGVQVFSIGLVGEIIIYTQAKNLKEYRLVQEDEEPVAGQKKNRRSKPRAEGRAGGEERIRVTGSDEPREGRG